VHNIDSYSGQQHIIDLVTASGTGTNNVSGFITQPVVRSLIAFLKYYKPLDVISISKVRVSRSCCYSSTYDGVTISYQKLVCVKSCGSAKLSLCLREAETITMSEHGRHANKGRIGPLARLLNSGTCEHARPAHANVHTYQQRTFFAVDSDKISSMKHKAH